MSKKQKKCIYESTRTLTINGSDFQGGDAVVEVRCKDVDWVEGEGGTLFWCYDESVPYTLITACDLGGMEVNPENVKTWLESWLEGHGCKVVIK